MEGILELLVVLMIVIVAPLWLILHYVTVWRRKHLANAASDVSADQQDAVRDLDALGRQLEERLDAVESILDSDVPGWRKQS